MMINPMTVLFTIQGVEVNDVQFAQCDEANDVFGVLGIGYKDLEATNDDFHGEPIFTYDNLPVMMKNQGLIHKNVYSIYDDAGTGSAAVLLFGAIDHAKYIGDLGLFPVASDSITLRVYLNGIYMGSSNGDSNVTIGTGSVRVLLDTGAPMTSFPSNVLDAILDQIDGYNATSADADGDADGGRTIYIAECSSLEDQTITFDFMGYQLTVPLSGFVVEKSVSGSKSECILGFDLADYSDYIFGESFLRNAYVVFDLDDNELAIGLVNTECPCDNDIEVITDGIPSATRAPGYSSSQTETGLTASTSS
ncbi:unnamed protein product [Ambrosiozyma monospora]|uniref:Unnamed protein product n=1 Tax=Ambrosiozyma monospora TaxID=43982 RepID=A0ACB5TAJ7_AMBMO|nr:unnamed protein product [Ambrosiozyma monospora]